MNLDRWITHFTKNQRNRVEPDWQAPITLPPHLVQPLVRSIEQFQLGDGGGPASLIAWNSERFRDQSQKMRELVNLWFTEEKEHSRLLLKAVSRFGGTPIKSHWSFSCFCFVRRTLGVNFELTVLLLTEIVSTVYYRLMKRHTDDPAIRAMCTLILRDEAGHVAFHRDRLACTPGAVYGKSWEWRFRLLGLGAATMLWINHAPGLKPLGATTREFYTEVWAELTHFIRQLRCDTQHMTVQKQHPRL